MHAPICDSIWVVYPLLATRTVRQRFIFRAAEQYGLISRVKIMGIARERVDKRFHDLMLTCPIPPNATDWKFQPTAEDFFVHLTLCRLDGASLPLPLETFTPKS